MRKTLIAIAAGGLAVTATAASAEHHMPGGPPPAIVRHANPENPNAIILQGVTVPAGAEMLYLSGMVPQPIDPSKPADSLAAFGDTKTQTISTLNVIKAALEARGYAMSDVIKLTVFLVGDPAKGGRMDFAAMNEGFRTFFGSASNPNTVARSTVQVAALAAPFFLVEIEATAAKMPTRPPHPPAQ